MQMGIFNTLFNRLRDRFRRRKYQEGQVVSAFIACDLRREVMVVSARRLDEGVITCRVRDTNLLYESNGLTLPSEFGEEQELRIDELWDWTGNSWGGRPDGSSITDHVDTD